MFTDTKIPAAVLENAGICQNCFIKFNEYDEHQALAKQIQEELLLMYRQSVDSLYEIKQEIKNEVDYNYSMDETVVELIEPEFLHFARPFIKKTSIHSTPAIVKVTSLANKIRSSLNPRRPTYVKKDKDAGLIICMINGVKHYQCEFCGKKDFTSRSRLKTHMQIHTNERNFMCQSCGASFKTMNCLKNHSRLHTNIFYHCDLCTSRFKGKHELRCHMVGY